MTDWNELLYNSTEEDIIGHEAQMLMFSFISEIEKHLQLQNLTRKELSKRIKTSASYITQVFRGDKPLNFDTLAKIQSALKIRFHVHASPVSDAVAGNEQLRCDDMKSTAKISKDGGLWKNFGAGSDVYEGNGDNNLIESFFDIHENNAIPA